jgi:post-segregation antitoxin (ccd killing protein)
MESVRHHVMVATDLAAQVKSLQLMVSAAKQTRVQAED